MTSVRGAALSSAAKQSPLTTKGFSHGRTLSASSASDPIARSVANLPIFSSLRNWESGGQNWVAHPCGFCKGGSYSNPCLSRCRGGLHVRPIPQSALARTRDSSPLVAPSFTPFAKGGLRRRGEAFFNSNVAASFASPWARLIAHQDTATKPPRTSPKVPRSVRRYKK